MTGVRWSEGLSDVFVGRVVELQDLRDVIGRVQQGQPWLATIEGPAGVGKTALARWALTGAEGLTVLSARCDPAETDIAYGVVEQLVRRIDRDMLESFPLLVGADGSSAPLVLGAEFLGLLSELEDLGPVVIAVDDLQWCDRPSLEAITFACRRLSVDPVLLLLIVRGDADALEPVVHRLVTSMARRLRLTLGGLSLEGVSEMARALGGAALDDATLLALHEATGGHALYLRTVLAEGFGADRPFDGPLRVPTSLTAAVGDQLSLLPGDTVALLETLSVLDGRVPLARVGEAGGVASPATALEPAVAAGLVEWWPREPSCPVSLCHALLREAIYAGLPAARRRRLHAAAVPVVDQAASWHHRVAALERPDETVAAELEAYAAIEAAGGQLALAARHLQWAADVTPGRDDRERRLLSAVSQLMLVDEARGLELRDAVDATRPSPLRELLLGVMAFAGGQLGEAERRYRAALQAVERGEGDRVLVAQLCNRLSSTYTMLGDGAKVVEFGYRALEPGTLDAAATSQTFTLIALGTSQVEGPGAALATLGHLDPDPTRVGVVDVDGLAFRGVFQLLVGFPDRAMRDLEAAVRLHRQGVTPTMGSRAYVYLALAQYLSGAWDDALVTADLAWAAAGIHTRQFELPMLHLAATCVLAGRGATEEAAVHAERAGKAAASLDYAQEQLYAGIARALVEQAAGNETAMAEALDPWCDDDALDGRTRLYGVIWRPLLAEGLLGAGRTEEAAAVLSLLRAQGAGVDFLQPALAWLEGQLAERLGDPDAAQAAYEHGASIDTGASPIYSAHLALAHGRLLRRVGNRKSAAERLRHASVLYGALRAEPFLARAEAELAAAGLHAESDRRRGTLDLTSREMEVAHLVGRGLSNAEVAAELFVSRKAVEYHLGNIYAKCGLTNRRGLRQLVAEWQQPAIA